MNTPFKRWALLGALDREVQLLREQMMVSHVCDALGTTFTFGNLHGQEVVVACCGIGKVNAAMCATWLLTEQQCDSIINVGIAGGVGKGLHTLDLVASTELCFHDQDPVMLKYFPATQFFRADERLLTLCRKACAKPGILQGHYREGRIASGDRFVADAETRAKIVNAFAPEAVEMEGAAIAHVAFATQKPFLVIRTMSDCADDDVAETYDNFLERAADQSAHILLALLQEASA